MIFYLLRETPVNSGCFVMAEHPPFGTADFAMDNAADLSAGGGRFAIYPYDPVRRTAPAAPAPVAVVDPAAAVAALDAPPAPAVEPASSPPEATPPAIPAQ